MERDYPNDDPHPLTHKFISFPISIFWALIFMIIFHITGVWEIIVEIWDPEYVKGGKYNPFAPSSVLVMISWFITDRYFKWYFSRTSIHEKLEAYYRPDNSNVNTYFTQGYLLAVFFFIAGWVTALLLGLFSSWNGVIFTVAVFICTEIWIRYEFEWKLKKINRGVH